jgi:RNA polymerase sigma factor (sigma-70 family)
MIFFHWITRLKKGYNNSPQIFLPIIVTFYPFGNPTSQIMMHSTDSYFETGLIQKILAGEPRLFEQIIRRYNQRLFRIGMSILHQDAEVEDAMQTTYVKTFEHLDTFQHRSSLGTWITRIMINECLLQKKNKLRNKISTQTEPPNYPDMPTPAQVLANKELSLAIEHAIAALPEKYRLVFVLREVEDLSVKETAEVLVLEEANIKVRLNRAKTMLRQHLSAYAKENVYAFHLSRCDLMVARVFARLEIGS